MVGVCAAVRLACREPPVRLPLMSVVEPGAEAAGCTVSYARPRRCLIAPSTEVTVEEPVEYRVEEHKANYLVELRYRGVRGERSEYYVYPKKVWDEITRRFIEPLGRGEPPREPGALLYGPPGTGKTSMARIIADIAAITFLTVNPAGVLSKWVGESEQRLAASLARAERLAPSLVLFDDAEWLMRQRGREGGPSDSAAATYLGMMSLILQYLQRWKNEGAPVAMIVTTNVGEEAIDYALRRSGRLGRPIYFPLPDLEAVQLIYERMGLPGDEAHRLARRVVAAGLSMADAVEAGRDALAGREPRIEPVKGRGYRRLVPPEAPPEARSLEEERRILCGGLRGRGRLGVALPSPVGVPVVAGLAGDCAAGMVLLTDPRHVDDAIDTANTSQAPLIIPADTVPGDIVRLAMSESEAPIVLVGPGQALAPYMVARIPLDFTARSREKRLAVLKMVAGFYGVELPERPASYVTNMDAGRFLDLLLDIALYQGDAEQALRLAGIGSLSPAKPRAGW